MRAPTRLSREILSGMFLLACAGVSASMGQFTSTWREPTSRANFEGRRVAAFFVSANTNIRREVEMVMARELTTQGARGVPGHELLTPDAVRDTQKALAVLNEANIDGVILIRVVGLKGESTSPRSIPPPDTTPQYASLAGYWELAWSTPTAEPAQQDQAILNVETLLFAVRDGAPVWAGASEADGSQLTKSATDLAEDAVKELVRHSVIRRR